MDEWTGKTPPPRKAGTLTHVQLAARTKLRRGEHMTKKDKRDLGWGPHCNGRRHKQEEQNGN